MNLLYLDTNVILTRYTPEEPQHEAAEKIVKGVEVRKLVADLSPHLT